MIKMSWNFLIFKDVNDSGRTVVHKDTCPYIGTTSLEHCTDKIQCGLRHQAESMRIGIVDKLRKGFEEVGRKGPYSLIDQMGDPTRSNLVREYISFIRQEQGKSGVVVKGARNMERFKMDRLMENMRLTIKGLKKGVRRLKVMERRGMYSFVLLQLKDWQELGMLLHQTLTGSLMIWGWLLIAHGIKHLEWGVIALVFYVLNKVKSGVLTAS